MVTEAIQRHRFTVDEFARMGEAGLFGEDDRIELIEGEIIEMVPIGPKHIHVVNRLTRHFVECAGDRAIVSVQNPLRLSHHSEPEPDFVLLDPRRVEATRVPSAEDALLVVEVADSSGDYDRGVKARLYAQAGIREYWLVDLQGQCVERFSDPATDGYRTTGRIAEGEDLACSSLPGCGLSLATLFADT